MPTQTRASVLEDPLVGFSGLSLFPRTLATVPNPPQPSDPDDLPHTHNFLKSLPLQSPDKFLDKSEAAATEVFDNPRERRPALGPKRARFSLNLNSSRRIVNFEPTLDIDELKDPEEFFKAYEELENAKKEIQKQTGGVLMKMDFNQLNPSMAVRPRRPGILGRFVKYKHRYSIDISSQETFEENILGSNDNVQQETTNPNVASQEETELADAELQESELVGAVAKKENKVSELLNELLTGEDEELDEEGMIALLQEHQQINPIDPGKLCLPDLQDRRIDLKASGADLPKCRNPLSEIHNLVKGLGSRTPKKRKFSLSCFTNSTKESTSCHNIFEEAHLLHSISSIIPFSAHDIGHSPARNTSPFGSIQKQSDEVNMENELSVSPKLKSPMIEDNGTADVHTSLPEVDMGDATHSSDKTVNDNLSRLDSGVDVGSSGCLADVVVRVGDSCLDNKVVSEISGRPDADTNIQKNEPIGSNDKEAVDSVQPDLKMEDSIAEKLDITHTKLDQRSRDVTEDHASDGPFKTADAGLLGTQQHNEVNSVQSDHNMDDSEAEKLYSSQTELDQTSHDVVEDHVVDGLSKTAAASPLQHTEKVQRSTRDPSTKPAKTISRPYRKGKREVATHRESLAEVRRSTRIRSRPLEYWKGERFLYGRVNETLTTVIGIKYESPGNADGKPGVKVKSFVSDEYKDLVELAARF